MSIDYYDYRPFIMCLRDQFDGGNGEDNISEDTKNFVYAFIILQWVLMRQDIIEDIKDKDGIAKHFRLEIMEMLDDENTRNPGLFAAFHNLAVQLSDVHFKARTAWLQEKKETAVWRPAFKKIT